MVRVYTPKKSEASIRKALVLLETLRSTNTDENLLHQLSEIRTLLNKAIQEL